MPAVRACNIIKVEYFGFVIDLSARDRSESAEGEGRMGRGGLARLREGDARWPNGAALQYRNELGWCRRDGARFFVRMALAGCAPDRPSAAPVPAEVTDVALPVGVPIGSTGKEERV